MTRFTILGLQEVAHFQLLAGGKKYEVEIDAKNIKFAKDRVRSL